MSTQTPGELSEALPPSEEPTDTVEPVTCSRERAVNVPLLIRSPPGVEPSSASILRVHELMQPVLDFANAHDSMRRTAQQMKEYQLVVLPVLEGGEIVGVIIDRDILLRRVALGEDPVHDLVADVMTREAHCCFAVEEVWRAAEQMHKWQVRQVFVINRERNLVGVLSLADICE